MLAQDPQGKLYIYIYVITHYIFIVPMLVHLSIAVIGYFITLGVSMALCFRGCTKKWTIPVSLLSMSVTWFYICRWTVHYKVWLASMHACTSSRSPCAFSRSCHV